VGQFNDVNGDHVDFYIIHYTYTHNHSSSPRPVKYPKGHLFAMFVNHLAYTASINDGKPEPRLTIPQVWAGLQRKIRAAQEFVPAITSTEVIEEKTDGKKGTPIVVREVVFKEGNRKVREECYEYAPIKVG